MAKIGRRNKWRDGDVLNEFKCVAQLTITRSQIYVNAPEPEGRAREGMWERERERKELIEQIQCPALLIRVISQLPGVNYHTHTSCCCSTYIIITVAKIENNLKLMTWGLLSPNNHTCKHSNMETYSIWTLHNIILVSIFCLSRLVYSWISPPTPCGSCFFGLISFI